VPNNPDNKSNSGRERFPLIAADLSADALEQQVLAEWRAENLFARTLAARANGKPFVFYEGPPTANGKPGIHHVFARTVKDLFCRHRAMQGRLVERKAGWDTHGLPVEIEVEKELQRELVARLTEEMGDVEAATAKAAELGGKQLIEKLGVAEFNRRCRENVWKYRSDWQAMSERIAYWLDYDHPYVTYENNYIESVWWALSTLHDKGLLTRGHKILPYCARCGTTLSSHEVAQGYEDVEDPSVFVAFELGDNVPEIGMGATDGEKVNASARGLYDGNPKRQILVWTTTPWTLVSNVGVAIHDDFDYVEVRRLSGDARTMILAESRLAGVFGGDWHDRWAIVSRYKGTQLAGTQYTRPLHWLPVEAVHGKIITERFVSADDGTGAVHMSPAFGADDYAAGHRHGLEFLQPIGADGHFKAEVPVVGGMWFKDADPTIEADLRERGILFKSQKYSHPYPHCWRCGTPLLYYARGSWFVRTTSFKDEMIARNRQVNWNPEETGSGRFGEWLSNNVDWAISRDRYWGTPLPVWVNDEDPTEAVAIGSFADLAKHLGRELPADFDPHKPHIDTYTWPAASGKGTMRRVPEVIDAWFDSGSMPFAQWHYPFENHDKVQAQFPADFIAEGVDQTRGWFYSLLAIATGLGDALPNNGNNQAAPFRAVVVNDMVLDANGQKMSKSKGNVVNPWDVMAKHGADAARLFVMASSQVWLPRRYDDNTVREVAGRFLLTLRNVYSGIFAQYANFGWEPSDRDPAIAERPPLDRWVLSRLTRIEQEVDEAMNAFDATVAVRIVMKFFDDDVSKWYVRLSRNRFYEVDTADNRAAFATLHEVLTVTCRLLAPFTPFLTDAMHRSLTGDSVHLASYVRANPPEMDGELEQAMDDIRQLATLAHAARDTANVKVRQPLPSLQCVVPGDPTLAMTLTDLLAAELNVKKVSFMQSTDGLVSLEGKANFRALGKKFGKETPLVAAAASQLGVQELRTLAAGGSVTIVVEGVERLIEPDDVTIIRRASGDAVVQEAGGYGVALDTTVTPELRAEGQARELISRVQRLRKEAGLDVSDRIALVVHGDDEFEAAVVAYRDRIMEETLAVRVLLGEDAESPFRTGGSANAGSWTATQVTDVEGRTVHLALRKEG
ncbi:MAG: isoleucine--tRNA ligase, partial [Gemmatimonadaceae bacterium]